MSIKLVYEIVLAVLLFAVAVLLAGCNSAPVRHGTHAAPTAKQTQPWEDQQDATRQRVVHAALEQLGAPYRYGGNGPRAFDCSGLVQYSHGLAGIRVPRVTWQQRAAADPVRLERLAPGDLVFFVLEEKGRHVGIYLGDGEFIHAPSSGKRVSISRLDLPYWRRHLVGAGTYL